MRQYCYQCGVAAEPDDQFCGNCGIAQPVAPASAALSPAVERRAEPPAIATAPVASSVPQSSTLSPASPADSAAGAAVVAAAASPEANVSHAAPDEVFPSSGGEAPEIEEPTPESTPGDEQPESPAVEDPILALSEMPSGADEAPEDLTVDDRETPEEEEAPAAVAAAEKPAAAGANTGEDGGSRRRANRGSTGGLSRTEGGGTGDRRGITKMLEGGTTLNNRYEIVRRIGGGGMGAVYLAKDRNLGDASRAVKEMVQSQMDESQQEKAVGDFKRESLLLTSLEHPSIPTIYDYFYDEDAGRFYLVMKYISGGDLLTRLRNAPGGRIDEKTVAGWGMELADVITYLHGRRPPIIYRDLKPANVMIDGNSGRVMLIDFGIARWVGGQEKGVTAVGTMGYAPPELFSGKVEARSDVYSLGATLFHLLTGADPQDNPLLIFDFNKHPRPRQINPSLSNEMERILMRAVEYKPEDRFASAAEFRDTLAQHIKDLDANRVSYGVTPADRLVPQTASVEMVFCGFCGGRIAATDLFCAYCGARQPLASPAGIAMQRAARITAKLIVGNTTELNSSFQLQKDSNLVGRSDPNSNIFPEVDLSRFDPNTKISRRHARIWREGEAFLVEDLGSINGTVVNDAVRLAPRQPRVLASGDRLRLGETTLHFLVG